MRHNSIRSYSVREQGRYVNKTGMYDMIHGGRFIGILCVASERTKLFILECLQAILFAGGTSFGNRTGSPRQDKNNFTSIRNEKKTFWQSARSDETQIN